MYDKLVVFINENRQLYHYQFGFYKRKSSSMALLTLTDNIT